MPSATRAAAATSLRPGRERPNRPGQRALHAATCRASTPITLLSLCLDIDACADRFPMYCLVVHQFRARLWLRELARHGGPGAEVEVIGSLGQGVVIVNNLIVQI